MDRTDRSRRGWSSLASFVWLLVSPVTAPAQSPVAPEDFVERVRPFLESYCVECHSEGNAEGGVALDRFLDRETALSGGRTWVQVLDALEALAMPPADALQPAVAERAAVTEWIEQDFFAAQCESSAVPPAVVMRRLNRQEYDNTIRDLLGLDLHLADDFPPDDMGFGYDNIGSALNVSPVHIEKYLRAAERAVEAAIDVPDADRFAPAELIGLRTYPLPVEGNVEFEHHLAPGRYLTDFSLVRVGVDEHVPPPRLSIGFGTDVRELDAVRVQDETIVYRFWISVAAGDRLVRVALAPGEAERLRQEAVPETGANVSGDQRYGSDRGMHVDSMVVRGPVAPESPQRPDGVRLLTVEGPMFGDEERCLTARRVISNFASRAFRRPARSDEVDQMVELFRLAQSRGESFERCCQVAFAAVLVSPQFLYLVEPPSSLPSRRLTDYELASRLSYFLWSTMPDEALMRAAADGTLRAELSQQVQRMLADSRSQALIENFVGQWLQLRNLATVTPDPTLFPEFDAPLRDSMRRETETFFGHIVREDRSLLELLSADYTFLNERLARHYEVPGVEGDAWRRVDLPSSLRGGLLTQASVLTLTSNPNRTSPVKRGKWILQQVLGTPPPPPPPNVADLDDSQAASDAASLRERLELHRANPECASCHRQMDALGFALENFDAIGRWREREGSFPIDASGELPGGQRFSGATELKAMLVGSAAKKFSRNLIENLLTYALGRSLEVQDYCLVENLRRQLVDTDYRAQALIQGIAESETFQSR
jgi:hypothetical protein